MGKGRKFVPSTAEQGIWFRHRGTSENMENRISATTTGTMLHNDIKVDSSSHIKCPPIFLQRIQTPYKQENPFSIHDNRNCLQNDGVYFTQGLGRQKTRDNINLRLPEDIITWGSKKLPEFQSGINSLYREDFLANEIEHIEHRRYPFHHPVPPTGLVPLSSSTTMWEPKNEMLLKQYLQTLADSQEPYLKPNPWRYSYHARSFAVPPRKAGRRRKVC